MFRQLADLFERQCAHYRDINKITPAILTRRELDLEPENQERFTRSDESRLLSSELEERPYSAEEA